MLKYLHDTEAVGIHEKVTAQPAFTRQHQEQLMKNVDELAAQIMRGSGSKKKVGTKV